MKHALQEIIERHKKGMPVGVYSVCSANPFVLRAAARQAKESDSYLLVEATSNQVDQYGGYTGMKPADFALMVRRIATECALPEERLILGGDHLGPNRWRHLNPEEAMARAREQIKCYVEAGFSKIHLDASMPLKGDSSKSGSPLSAELVAQRSADLCVVAEEAARNFSKRELKPVYVIGTDVPVPGGAVGSLETVRITPVEEVKEVLQQTQEAFFSKGLQDAWERTIAVVVQPGVEFGNDHIADYQREYARELKQFIEAEPQFVYEAHSTDYQNREALRAMVEDHFVILKVGPALTFALREAVFALSFMEDILAEGNRALKPSNMRKVLDRAMLRNPEYWQKHYGGTKAEKALARRFSFSDRIRYYWPEPEVQQALQKLLSNLRVFLPPLSLISQFMPAEYEALRRREIELDPETLIDHKIRSVLKDYVFATSSNTAEGNSVVQPLLKEPA